MARASAIQEIEASPEADRLEPYLHPRDSGLLFGHEAAEASLAQMFASGRMHHGWLLTGAAGIGKATLAYRFARHILARPDERDPFGASLDVAADTIAARQVRALSHQGLLVIRRQWMHKDKRFGASIPVDEVRRLKGFLALSAEADAWRVVVVDPVDELNASAANALLKALEEPPPRTVFLLICAEPGRLLPTIRSRCRTLELSRLGKVALEKAAVAALAAIDKPPPDDSQRELLAIVADGSVRRYLALASSDGLKLYNRMLKQLERLPAIDWSDVHQLGDELSGAAATLKYEQYFEMMLDLLATLIRASAGAEAGPRDKALALRVIPADKFAAAAEIWNEVAREKADTDALNLDKKQLLLSLFQKLQGLHDKPELRR